MPQPLAHRTEFVLRYLRQVASICLAGLLPALAYGVLTAWDLAGQHERLRVGVLLLSPAILALGLAWVLLSRRGAGVAPADPAFQVAAQDEFRRLNALRACRAALATVLVAQVPLAWLLGLRPGPDSLAHMATLTWGLGFASFLAAFLVFDRD